MTQVISNEVVDTVRNKFGFSVDKFPLAGPEGLRTPFYGLFRSDSLAVVGNAVTSRYVPHTTDDILALVEASALAFDGVAEVKCGFHDGHYVSVQPTLEYRKSIFGTNDNIWPRVMIKAGYDGRAFRACMGYFRDACQNMAILRSIASTTVAIRHTSGLRPKMDELVESFQTLHRSWNDLTATAEALEAKRVNMVEFLKAVYGEPTAESGRAVTMHKNRTEAIFARLYGERLRTGRPAMGSDWMVSGWEAFNAVQGYVQHDATRHGSNDEFDRIILASNDLAVQRAERLVFDMAV